MNPLDAPEVEERLTQMLSIYDEATRSGKPAALDLDSAPPGLRERFEELRGCVDLLEGAWQRRERLAAEEADPEFLSMLEGPAQIGRFHIVRLLGRGGSGSVYLAHDPKLRRDVALKVPSRETVLNPKTLERVWREAQVTAKLNHANLVPILDVVEIDKVPCLVSVYVRGVSLATWMARNGPADPHAAAGLVAALADGVANMSDCGVVHRDLKPANILLEEEFSDASQKRPDGRFCEASLNSTPKIVDFGLALDEYRTTQLTENGAVLGTVPYMSPEQVDGRLGAVSHRSDVHALGAVLYEMVTGRPPFTGNSAGDILRQIREAAPVPPSSVRPAIPSDLDTICLACLEKFPTRRYTARELAAELRRFLAGEPIERRPPGFVERSWRWLGKNSRHVAAAAMLLVAIGMSVTFGVLWRNSVRPTAAVATKSPVQLTQEALGRAFVHFNKAEVSEGTLALADALDLVPPNDPDLENLIRRALAVCKLAVIRRHADLPLDNPAKSVLFSPDSKLLLSLTENGTVQLWDVETAKPHGPPREHPEKVLKAVFSADGTTFQTACLDGRIRTWDVATDKLVRSEVVVPVFGDTPNDKKELHERLLWQLVTGKPVPQPLEGKGFIAQAELSPDSKIVQTLSTTWWARRWDAETASPMGLGLPRGKHVLVCAWHRDGRRVATGGQDGLVQLWSITTSKEFGKALKHASPARAVLWGPGRDSLLTGDDDSVRLWVPFLELIAHRLPSGGSVNALASSPSGHWLAAGTGNGSVRLWSLPRGEPPVRPPVRDGVVRHKTTLGTDVAPVGVQGVAIHPDGRRFVTAGVDDLVHFWDWEGKSLTGVSVQHVGVARRVAFSPDGGCVLTGGDDKIAQVWDAANGVSVGAPMKHEGWVSGVAFSPNGSTALTTCQGGPARLWNPRTGTLLSELGTLQGTYVAAYDPDGSNVLVGGKGPNVTLHDLRTGVERVFAHGSSVHALAFSPDGQSFVTGGDDGVLQWWDRRKGVSSGVKAHSAPIWSVAFSRNGRWVVTGSKDNHIRFWDAATGQVVGPPLWLPGMVREVVFHPLGKTVAVACGDGQVHFLPVPEAVEGTREEVARAARLATGWPAPPAQRAHRDNGNMGRGLPARH